MIFKLGCTGLKFLIGAVACLFVGVQIMFEYRYVLFWDRNDNTQCIISGKKKCDRACVGVVDQNRGWLGTHYCIRRKIVTTAKNLSRIQICACERSVSNSVL